MKKSKKKKLLIIPILALSLILNLTLPVSAEVTDATASVQTEGSLIDEQQVKPEDTKEEDLKEDPEEEKKEEGFEYSEKEKPAEEQEGEKKEDDFEDPESDPLKEETDPNVDEAVIPGADPEKISGYKELSVEVVTPKKVAFKEVGKASVSADTLAPSTDSPNSETYSASIVSAEWINDGEKISVTAKIEGNTDNVDSAQIYLAAKTQTTGFEGDTASATLKIGNNNKDYEIYAEFKNSSGDVLAESEHITVRRVSRNLRKDYFNITDSSDEENTGIIQYVHNEDFGNLEYGPNANQTQPLADGIATGLGKGTYYIIAPGYAEGYTYYNRTSTSVTVKGGNNSGKVSYVIRTSGDDNVTFSPKTTTVDKGDNVSLYIKPVDSKTHYIDSNSIKIEPADNAESFSYAGTGELNIINVTGDITIYASSKEKITVSSLNVKSVSFNENGIYSELSPGIQTQIEVEAKDKNGNPVPDVTLYLKKDRNDVSFAQSRKTDANGIAGFKLSYEINRENGSTSEDYTALIGIDSGFSGVSTTTDIHLILQLKSDLVLYTDQIIGTKPDQNDGKIINVPEGYEIWTGDVHDGYLVVGSGEWEKIVNGEYSGLSSGLHALRAGAKTDGNTYYFASDCDFFEVPRGTWDITIDKAGSENVIFTGNESLTAEPGGTVYVYLKPADGFKIDTFSVNKPSYVSGRIFYSEDNGYIVIEGISGSLVLTVNAVKSSVNTPVSNVPEDDKTVVNENDPPSRGDTDENNYDNNEGTYDGSNEDTPVISFIAPAQIPYVLNSDIVIPAGTVLSARVPKRTTVSTVQKKTFHEVADEIISNGDKAPKPEKAKDPVEKEIKESAETKTIEGEAVALSGSLDVETDLKEANRIWILLLILLLVAIITGAYVIQKQKGNENDPVGK